MNKQATKVDISSLYSRNKMFSYHRERKLHLKFFTDFIAELVPCSVSHSQDSSFLNTSYIRPPRTIAVSVLLLFNPSLMLLIPSSPILFTVHFHSISVKENWQLSFNNLIQLRYKKANELLHFNASLIILAPSSPISFPIRY